MRKKIHILKKVLLWVCRSRALLFYETFGNPELQEHEITTHFNYQFADEVTIKNAHSYFSNKKVWRFYLDNVQDGSLAFLIWHKDAIIHRSLAIKGPKKIRVPGFGDLFIKNKEYYISHCETDEEYRGNGLYPLAINSLAREAISKYLAERIFVVTDYNNFASQKGIMKAGLVYSGIETRLALLGTRISLPISIRVLRQKSFERTYPISQSAK